MNQRIKELLEQAGVKYVTMPNDTVYEKFAELIVRECLTEIDSQRSNGENADQWTITRDLCYHNMIAGLKQHFGVE